MATVLDGVRMPAQSAGGLQGPLMTLKDWAALQRAPKRRPGTRVTVRAYDVPGARGPLGLVSPDHMYVEYDDGRQQLIARGGPSGQGRDFLGRLLRDDLQVVGEVTPARENRDHGRGERVVFEGFLPGAAAQEAAEPARRQAEMLARSPRRYRSGSNSNSYAADAVEPLFGVRPGDWQTWGADRPLDTAPRTQPFGMLGYRTMPPP